VIPTTDKLRICLVGPSLDILGGQAIQLDRLRAKLGALPDLEVSFVPVNPRLPGPLGVLQRIKYVRTVVTSVAYFATLLRVMRSVDVVHVFSASYWSFLLAPAPAMLIGRLYGRQVILNYHSGEADDHLTNWRSAVPLMRLVNSIAVPSAFLVEVFSRHGLTARPIFNFVDAETITYRHRAEIRPVFFSNRNLEPMYNVGCTIRAFALIQARVPGSSLTIAGDGSQRPELEALVQKLGLRAVTFLGRVAPSGMTKHYETADVYLNSSDIDNMPLSVIEAFAAGLPVVTTSAGGIPYVVTHGSNGLLVPCNDHEALAREALRVLEEPGLAASLTARAREECLSRYVWPAVKEQWLALYRELAGKEVRAPAATPGAA
jgi:glycosyltransferase involved in cell wall biosynthesis